MSGRVVHFEIPFDDAERAMSFYRGLFGWDLQTLPGEFGGYVMVSTGPTGEQGPAEPGYINGGLSPRDQSTGAVNVVIDVEDIDAKLKEIEAQGGEVMAGRAAVGEMGFAAYFKDPEGNVVGLWENAPGQG
jgi:predicted enzyme related to lactoylglutathione lyase